MRCGNIDFGFICKLTLSLLLLGTNNGEIKKWDICIPYYLEVIKCVVVIVYTYGTKLPVKLRVFRFSFQVEFFSWWIFRNDPTEKPL